MKFSPDDMRRIADVLDSDSDSFVALARLAGLRPGKDFVGADLQRVNFGTDDLSHFNFKDADLCGADLSRTKGLGRATLTGARIDSSTILPPDWDKRSGAGLSPALTQADQGVRRELLTVVEDGWADDWGMDQYGAWASFTVKPARGKPVVQRLRWCPPGQFLMGSPEAEAGHFDPEGPRHQVTFAAGFWLFDTACTQALWQAVMGDNPSGFKGRSRPVESASIDRVQAFLDRLNALRPKLRLSLPSEAQWEYACRAGTETATYAGDLSMDEGEARQVLDPIAWYAGNSGGTTHPVGEKVANRWGILDMLGNVFEWCADTWHPTYDGAPADGSAWVDGSDVYRVVRGGCWNGTARIVRSAYRGHDAPADRGDDVGFRCVRVQGSGAAVAGREEPAQARSDGRRRPARRGRAAAAGA